MPDWTLIHQWDGGNTYIDNSQVKNDGSRYTAWVLMDLDTPAQVKFVGKAAKQLVNLEEYDGNTRQFRVLRMLFRYVDGTADEPFTVNPKWAPATVGNEITLNYLINSQSA